MAIDEERILKIIVDSDKAIDKIIEYREALEALRKKEAELKRQKESSEIEEQQYRSEMEQTRILTKQYTESIRILTKEVNNNIKSDREKSTSLKGLRAQLSNLTAAYDNLQREERESARGRELLDKINNVTKELKEAEMATQRYYRNVGNYASAFNGLSMGVQQVARELPSLSVGFSTFFLAISNNLPILIDQIALARKEYDALIKAGKNATPVWKQLISSIFSWQTALVVGVTALTLYGKEIGNWIKSLFTGEKALYDIEEAAENFNETMSSDAGESIANLEAMSKQWKALGGNLKEQEKYLKENADRFKELGIEIKNSHDAENAFVRNKDAVIASLKQRAMATAAMGEAQKLYTEYIKKQTEAEKMPEKIKTMVNTGNPYQANWVSGEYENEDRKKALKEAEELQKKADELINKFVDYSEAEEELLNNVGLKKVVSTSKALKKKAEKTEEDLKKTLAKLQKDIDAELAKQQKEYEMRLAKTKAEGATEGTWEQHAANLELLRIQRDQELEEYGTTEEMKLAIKKKYDKLMNDENMAYHRERVAAEQETKEKEIAIQMEKVQAMSAVADSLVNLLAEVGESNKAAAVMAKVVALAQIAISTGEAIAKMVGAEAGKGIAGLVTMATGIATILSNIAIAIKTVKSAKFSTGGDVSGEGTSTSDSIPAMLSDGESVMTAKATSMFAPILSAFNQAGGGVPIYGQQAGSRAMGEDMLAKSFAKGLEKMPAPVVSVEEISNVTNRVKVIENINRI